MEERCRCLWEDSVQTDYEDAACSLYSSAQRSAQGGSCRYGTQPSRSVEEGELLTSWRTISFSKKIRMQVDTSFDLSRNIFVGWLIIIRRLITTRPVTVAECSKAWTVFARSDAGTVSSNPTRGMDVCVCLFWVFVRWRPCDGLITRPRSPTDVLDYETEVKQSVSRMPYATKWEQTGNNNNNNNSNNNNNNNYYSGLIDKIKSHRMICWNINELWVGEYLKGTILVSFKIRPDIRLETLRNTLA
jgi:hypothetical protein